ncbi:hypothetical protein R6V09_01700 [Streptomyces sp. W16]|uniref:hypothetical protein n=1 Tax=Streptomyces sp. W16 TaxID=3076631 RepID=UPI00295C1686|nr:hypothetical protein [Streptomyces sp. W16]MDV9168856.1 hypothetical protein [Streptomyces sp. W16]
MAAADGLELYLQALGTDKRVQHGDSRRILCEYQEDWVALSGDTAELVSAKHRDPSADAYRTVNQLAHEGGLAHLFLRWRELQEKPTCRLATTGGLASGDPQGFAATMRSLREVRLSGQEIVITDDHRPSIEKFHSAIHANSGKHLPKEWIKGSEGEVAPQDQMQQAARFISMLNIQAELTRRADIGFAAPTRYAKPVVEHLGFDVPWEAIWNVVYGLFFTRMKAAGPRTDAVISPVLAFANGSGSPTSADRERELSSRIVTMQDIDLAIITAVANPSAYGSLTSPIRLSRAAIKMRKGSCSDNSVERGEQLRRDYQRYWRSRLSGDPTALAEREKLRRLLLRVSDRSDTPAMRSKSGWGADFWIALQDALENIPVDQLPAGMDSDLLLGGISDLANECKIWFSEGFDVAAEIDRIRQENRGSAA